MVKRNPFLAELKGNYLFPEVNQRKKQFLQSCPEAKLISLGIGDTTEPLPSIVATALSQFSKGLETHEGYFGYGPEQGIEELRQKIATVIYSGRVKADEIFISDGAKCDIGRLQTLFGGNQTIAVQDPAYPVYVDGSLIHGVKKISHLSCIPENDFFPDLNNAPRTDLIYFCSPNNPTGAVATRSQLMQLVAFAKANRSILLFDAAYANYIQDPDLPKSIFEIPGAKEVAIEISSFSKLIGFTGVRLGWTVVPEQVCYEDGSSVKNDWQRITSTIFNGASNIAQWGGLTALSPAGLEAINSIAHLYLENARIIKEAIESSGEVFGGSNAPYLWVRFKECDSWDLFQQFLENLHIVTTPGSGFGPAGESFLRLSAFGRRENILQAAQRIRSNSCY